MPGTDADAGSIAEIRRLAENPTKVRVTERATYDLLETGITKEDVCVAICSWIDDGRVVEVGRTSHVREHAGKPHYVMRPDINGRRTYVKVALPEEDTFPEQLLLVSCHE